MNLFLHVSHSPEQQATMEFFTTQQLFGCICTESQSRVSNGPCASLLLVKFLQSVSVSYIHVKTLQFLTEKQRGCALRSALHPASVGSISLVMDEQLVYN